MRLIASSEKAGKALFRCLYERKPQAPNMAMNLAVNLPPEDIQDLLRSVSGTSMPLLLA